VGCKTRTTCIWSGNSESCMMFVIDNPPPPPKTIAESENIKCGVLPKSCIVLWWLCVVSWCVDWVLLRSRRSVNSHLSSASLRFCLLNASWREEWEHVRDTCRKLNASHASRKFVSLFWFCRDRPQCVMASSFSRFLVYTLRRTTVGRIPLNEGSARRRDLYLTTHNTHNWQTSCRRWDSNPQSQQASGLRSRGYWRRRQGRLVEFIRR